MIISGLKSTKVLFAFLFSIRVLDSFAQGPILPPCPSPNEHGSGECENLACRLCNLNGYIGSSAGFGPDPDGDLPPWFCGDSIGCVQNIAFYIGTPDLDITVTASNCTINTGIDIGLMHSACDVFPLTDCVSGHNSNSSTLSLSGVEVGPYILIVDVDATGPCDLTISVNPPDGTIPVVPPVTDITGEFDVCPGLHTIYQVDPYCDGATYDWTFPPGVTATLFEHGKTAVVDWGISGGDICVRLDHPCYPPDPPFCKPVTITAIPPTVFPPVILCAEEVPYELPWGETASTSGTYTITAQSYKGCDSTLIQTVTVRPGIVTNLAPIVLCEGSCLTKCGQSFCGYDDFSVVCQSYTGCDSVINFSTVPPFFTAEILGGSILTCSEPTSTLTAAPSAGIASWTNSAGQSLGTGNSVTVNSAGTYFLTVTLMVAGQPCTKTSSIEILSDNIPPIVTATGALLGCDTFPTLLHANSFSSPVSYGWSGPNGFISNLQNPAVTELGTYIVTVVDFANGCSAKDTVLVTCCPISAGTLDSALITLCGEKNLQFNFHGDQILGLGDSLVFILYSDPADPFGSILLYSDTTIFPFVPGLQQLDSVYYVAAFVGSVLPDTSTSFQHSCWALSPAQPVRWVQKPGIMVVPSPFAACKGDCMDITFQFTGTPPFQFHFNITQNGVLLFSTDEISDALQKTITVCPSTFSQTVGSVSLNLNVNYLQDTHCNCND